MCKLFHDVPVAILALLIAFCIIPCKNALSQFTVTGDIDARTDYLHLHRIVSDSLNSRLFNLAGSAKIDVNFRHKKLDAYMSLEAQGSSGTSLFSTAKTGTWSANAYETWLKYKFTNKFSVQAGRIEISYEDEQFLQARTWDKLITSHNAMIAHWLEPDTGFMADLGFAANRFKGPGLVLNTDATANSYRYMGYLYMHRRLIDKKLNLTLSDILDGSDNGISRETLYGRNTFGLVAWLAWPDWDLSLSGYYQNGHITDGRRLSALYYSGYFGYQATGWLSLMLAYEHMSGDDLADTAEWAKTVHGFSMLYGDTRKDLGLSGMLNTFSRSNISPGLNNLYFKATFEIMDDFTVEANYHWFTLPHAYVRNIDPISLKPTLTKVTSSLFHEADMLLTYTPVKTLKLSLGFALIIPGRSLHAFNGWNFTGNHLISTGYLEIEFTPVLFHGSH